jgi:Outer membrane protein beta-barrel domain
MKKILFLFIALIAFVNAKSQDSTYLELGINTARLLTLRDNKAASISPYVFTVEYKFSKKIGLRAGMGMYSNSEIQPANASNLNVRYQTDTSASAIRVGLVFYKTFNDKWSIKYGLDGQFNKREKASQTDAVDATNTAIRTTKKTAFSESGVDAFLFAQYHLTKRVSLGTEMMFAFLSSKSTDTETNSQFPTFDSTIDKNVTKRNLMAPTSLFLIFRF